MVLVLVDDLIFLSKVRTVAGKLGVPIVTARSTEGAIADMTQAPPAMVIVDLNCRRADPLATVAAMRADPALRDIPTVAFAGHTQLDLLAAARESGIGEVLTRGAFNDLLPGILARAATPRPGS
jgi:CheY-like chemotaxis protein